MQCSIIDAFNIYIRIMDFHDGKTLRLGTLVINKSYEILVGQFLRQDVISMETSDIDKIIGNLVDAIINSKPSLQTALVFFNIESIDSLPYSKDILTILRQMIFVRIDSGELVQDNIEQFLKTFYLDE